LDKDYAALLVQYEQQFWSFVEHDEPPPGAPAVAPPVRPALYRSLDMSNSNSWAELAAVWLATIGPARRCEKSAKELRAMIEDDVGCAAGHNVQVKRSKDGRLLYISEIKS